MNTPTRDAILAALTTADARYDEDTLHRFHEVLLGVLAWEFADAGLPERFVSAIDHAVETVEGD